MNSNVSQNQEVYYFYQIWNPLNLNTNMNPFYPSKLRELKRQRYMSESAAQGDSQEMLPHGSKVFICSEVSKSGSSLCVSMDFGLGEQSKSTLTHLFKLLLLKISPLVCINLYEYDCKYVFALFKRFVCQSMVKTLPISKYLVGYGLLVFDLTRND